MFEFEPAMEKIDDANGVCCDVDLYCRVSVDESVFLFHRARLCRSDGRSSWSAKV